MKNLLLTTFAVILLCGTALTTMAGEVGVDDPRYSEARDITVVPYYEAMKNGEVDSLRNYLTTRRYAVNRTLIEQNAAYPDHLRSRFRDAEFDVLRITEEGTRLTAFVRIYWPDGRESETTLGLIEDLSRLPSDSVRWKIDRD